MPYDPDYPQDGDAPGAHPMREQLNALHDEILAVPQRPPGPQGPQGPEPHSSGELRYRARGRMPRGAHARGRTKTCSVHSPSRKTARRVSRHWKPSRPSSRMQGVFRASVRARTCETGVGEPGMR